MVNLNILSGLNGYFNTALIVAFSDFERYGENMHMISQQSCGIMNCS